MAGNNDNERRKPQRPNHFVVKTSTTEDTSIVGLTEGKMTELGFGIGDYLLLKGKHRRETVCVLVPNTDSTTDTVMTMNTYTCKNLLVNTGDIVRARIFRGIKYAARIQVLPIADTLRGEPCNLEGAYLRPYFLNAFRPVTSGDTFAVHNGMTTVEFKVMMVDPKPTSIVVKDTAIQWQGTPISRQAENALLYEIGYDNVGGCGKALATIRDILDLPLRHPEIYQMMGIQPTKGILMYGPSGTGKTLIAKAVANETDALFTVINGPEIVSKWVGESEAALRKIFETAERHNGPAIIFMDEVDAIAPKRDKCHGDSDRRIVSQLLTLMDGVMKRSQTVVMAATNRPNSIDPALRRDGRFDCEVYIGIPDTEGRLEILNIHTRRLRLAANINLEKIAKETHGFVGADLAALCSAAAQLQIQEKLKDVDLDEETIDPNIIATLAVTQDNFECALKKSHPSMLRETNVELPNVTWDDVGGLEDVKRQLQEVIQYPVEHPEKYRKFGMAPPTGVLFYGPPGCGKTLLAKAIASQCQANFISIKGPELLSKLYGESESNVRNIFEMARSVSPCVLFFDELDSIAKARGQHPGDCGASDRVISQLLTEMDGLNPEKLVFVVGATNRPDVIDSAILRSGRLDAMVYIPVPDEPSRLQIFRAALKKTPIATDVNLEGMARDTDGFSGADIKDICKRACSAAIKEWIQYELDRQNQDPKNTDCDMKDANADPVPHVTKVHFKEAMKNARSSVRDSDIKFFKQFTESQNRGHGSGSSPSESGSRDKFDYLT